MKGFRTRAVHSGQHPDLQTGAHATPIYQTSTFSYGSFERGRRLFNEEEEGYLYSRIANPTVRVVEQKLADLEGAEDAVAFASGMGAISAVALSMLSPGDEVAFIGPLYGGTEGFFLGLLARLGILPRDISSASNIEAALGPKTRMLYVETPTNPTLRITDLAEVARVGRAKGILTVADNTFASPYLTRPLEHGIDLVVHSATKYLGGHGDLVAGVVAGPAEIMRDLRMEGLRHIGASLGPTEAYLLLRGMKTLPLRMEAHCEGAERVAAFLAGHQAVKQAFYPGLSRHPGHEIAKKQMRHYGGMVSLELPGGQEAAGAFLDELQLFTQAVSLGDVESLATHPASTTHQLLPAEVLASQGVTQGLVRLSIGIEDPEDLIEDIAQALDKASAAAAS